MAWRAYVGHAGITPYVNVRAGTWGAARDALAGYLEPYRTDECSDCREQGTGALGRLAALTEGAAFWDEVDGEEVALKQEH